MEEDPFVAHVLSLAYMGFARRVRQRRWAEQSGSKFA